LDRESPHGEALARTGKQSRTDPVRRLADAGEQRIAAEIAASFRAWRDGLDQDALAQALSLGDYAAATELLPEGVVERGLTDVFARIHDLYDEGAGLGTAQLQEIGDGIGIRLEARLDRLSLPVTEELRARRAQLIEDIRAGGAETAQQVMMSGLGRGLSTDEIAGEIADTLGLSARQAQAVINLRERLETGDSEMPPAAIDETVSAYAERSLEYRSLMIARTESVRAANGGLRAIYEQAVENGDVPEEAVTRFWQTAEDEEVCDECGPVPEDYPDGVGMGEEFDVGDPPVHPNCRCSVAYETSPAILAANIGQDEEEA
jgi:hypothetical protein